MMCRRWSVLPVALVLSLASAAATARSLEDRLRERIPESTRLALALTEEDEIALGRRASARLLGVAPLVEDRGVQDYVNRVGRWIAQGSGRPNLPWRFGVIDSADVNAFAAPGGFVLLTRALYQSLDSEAELAGVLAHEIAHVTERHQTELLRQQLLLEEGRDVLRDLLRGDREKLVERLAGAGAELFARRLDRAAEFDADRRAVVLAARAGYDPYGLPAVLQKIGAVAETDDRVRLLYRTHPPPAERLRRLADAMGPEFLEYGSNAGGALHELR
jgi:predicted Zn-dependent protease